MKENRDILIAQLKTDLTKKTCIWKSRFIIFANRKAYVKKQENDNMCIYFIQRNKTSVFRSFFRKSTIIAK